MGWWYDKAARIQQRVRSDEIDSDQDHGDEEVRRATIHAREDIILIVSHLSALNRQLETIKIIFWLILALLVTITVKLVV
jgi:hypothetical protein